MPTQGKIPLWEQTGRLMFIGVASSGLVLLVWNNACDDLIGMWYGEYVNQDEEVVGSGKWRTPMGSFL
jgi:hypothetical protein